jgi:excisionase family DNA binding protein
MTGHGNRSQPPPQRKPGFEPPGGHDEQTRRKAMTDTSFEVKHSKLIDVEAAAVRLGVSPRFVRRLVSERRVGFFKVGKYIRFDPTELDAWLAGCRVDPWE